MDELALFFRHTVEVDNLNYARRSVVSCAGYFGQVPKWPKGADCKSVAIGFQGSNPCLPTTSGLFSLGVEGLDKHTMAYGVLQSVGEMGGRSSVVEFQPSKLAVVGSNPIARSIEDVIREA